VIIIDEIGMLSANTLGNFHSQLKEARGNGDLFGGVHMLFVGDFRQLEPVRGNFCFLHTSLWRLTHCVMLTKSWRQDGDAPYASMLDRVCRGCAVEADVKMLNSRNVQHLPSVPEDALIVTFHRQSVHTWNSLRIRDLGQSERKAFIGMKVMIRQNICTRIGLANGATGVVVGIPRSDVILVRLQTLSADGCTFGTLPHGVVPIVATETRKSNELKFQMQPYYAITGHKVQGQTLPAALR
jgi:ATP-dependent exoDNAse (exonuclease V) alpha subunit